MSNDKLPPPYQKPYVYEDAGTRILDANGMWVLDLRGWGYLTGGGHALVLSSDKAIALQDEFGRMVAGLLNMETQPTEPYGAELDSDQSQF